MIHQNKSVKLNILMFFVVITMITSCGDKPESTSTASTETSQQQSDTTKTPAFSYGDFSVLVLPKAKLAGLFANNKTQKILLQFVDDNSAGDAEPFGLAAYGTTKANDTTSLVTYLELQANTNPINIAGQKILGNLELTRAQINRLIGNSGNRPITNENAKDLIFTPQQALGQGHVVYKVNVPATEKIAEDESTNPSPPAKPCNPCDQ